MIQRTLAKRYARALLEVARERKEVKRVHEEIDAVAALWRAVPELRTLVHDPARPRARKQEMLERALAGKVSALVQRFLAVLLDHGRFAAIEEVAHALRELSDEAQGIARARVTTFKPLAKAQKEALVARLVRLTDRPTVELEETVDPSVLGGLLVRIGDQVLDGSIRGRLRRLYDQLIMREAERAAAAAAMAAEGGLD